MIGTLALLLAATQSAPRNEQERLLFVAQSWKRAPFAFGGYALPAEAAADPPLRRVLLRRMERDRSAAVRIALQNRAELRRRGWYFNPHHLRFAWRIEGDSSPLLSLAATATFYAGEGGYDAHRAAVLLWDRAARRPVEIRRLLGRGLSAWRLRYCAAREAAGELPASRLNGPLLPLAITCPIPGADTLAPADSDGNGRFDRMRLFRTLGEQNSERMGADELPFRSEDLAALPRRYRAAFEVPASSEPRLGVELDPD